MSITFSDIWNRADKITGEKGPQTMVVLGARDEYSQKAVNAAVSKGWIKPIFARLERQVKLEEKQGLEPLMEECEVLTAPNDMELVKAAVDCAARNNGFLMRGRITVQDMVRALLHCETNFTLPRKLVTHIGFFESDKFPRLIMVTDGGVIIKPTLGQKAEIVRNAIAVARGLSFERPKVAMLAAVEAVYLQMEASLDDAVVAKMADRGTFGDAVVDGPLSFDVALVPRAAQEKKVKGEVAGQADILVAPRIEVGNGLYKILFMFGHSRSAGILTGGKFPVVMTSRSQSLDSKMNSLALAIVLNYA